MVLDLMNCGIASVGVPEQTDEQWNFAIDMLCVINYIELFTFAFNRLNIFCLGSFNIIIKYYSKDGVETKIKFKMT